MTEKLCGAKTTTQGGRPCRNAVVPGRNRCRFHGGKTPASGPAHHAYTHGRYSKWSPKSLASKIDEARQDPELLSLHEEIALVQAMIPERLERLNSIPNDTLRNLAKLAGVVEATVDDPSPSVKALVRCAKDAGNIGKLFDEVAALTARKATLVKAEWQRLNDLDQLITAERAHEMFVFFLKTINEHVQDKATINAIAEQLGACLLGTTGQRVAPVIDAD